MSAIPVPEAAPRRRDWSSLLAAAVTVCTLAGIVGGGILTVYNHFATREGLARVECVVKLNGRRLQALANADSQRASALEIEREVARDKALLSTRVRGLERRALQEDVARGDRKAAVFGANADAETKVSQSVFAALGAGVCLDRGLRDKAYQEYDVPPDP